jgi:hypothetical protein
MISENRVVYSFFRGKKQLAPQAHKSSFMSKGRSLGLGLSELFASQPNSFKPNAQNLLICNLRPVEQVPMSIYFEFDFFLSYYNLPNHFELDWWILPVHPPSTGIGFAAIAISESKNFLRWAFLMLQVLKVELES